MPDKVKYVNACDGICARSAVLHRRLCSALLRALCDWVNSRAPTKAAKCTIALMHLGVRYQLVLDGVKRYVSSISVAEPFGQITKILF